MADSERNGLVSNGHSHNSPGPAKSERALSNWQRFSYGVGHVFNDLVASMWFSYLLIFLHSVEHFDNFLAGNLLLIGQVADALCTPFVGFESDNTKKGFCGLGKRKSWHLIGTICVFVSFPFLFHTCLTCKNAPSIAQFIYFSPFVVILQFGWASTQISHLSLSSELTPFNQERVTLQSIRNVFTILANISVYGIFTLLFVLESNRGSGKVGPEDASKFTNLALICMGIGIIFNIIFYTGTHRAGEEKSLTNAPNSGGRTTVNNTIENGEVLSSIEISAVQHSLMTWKDWLKNIQFYQIALVYMCSRLYINVSQVYLSIYLTETLDLPKIYISILPLLVYSGSFITSILTPFINKYLGRKLAFVVGVVFGLASSTWMYFIPSNNHQVYGSAILLGVAGSILLITALSMTSDLIATNTESGAFVFGAMSFTDKLSNGVAIFVIQKLLPRNCLICQSHFYRDVQSIVPGVALIVAFIGLLTLVPQNIGDRNKKTKMNLMRDSNSRSNTLQGGSAQCSCGQYYTPPNRCLNCDVPPSGVAPHFPSLVRQPENSTDDDDEDNSVRERLLANHDTRPPNYVIGDIN